LEDNTNPEMVDFLLLHTRIDPETGKFRKIDKQDIDMLTDLVFDKKSLALRHIKRFPTDLRHKNLIFERLDVAKLAFQIARIGFDKGFKPSGALLNLLVSQDGQGCVFADFVSYTSEPPDSSRVGCQWEQYVNTMIWLYSLDPDFHIRLDSP